MSSGDEEDVVGFVTQDASVAQLLVDSKDGELEYERLSDEQMEEAIEESKGDEKRGEWPAAVGVLAIPRIYRAFLECQPTDPNKYLFGPNLVQGSEEGPKDNRRRSKKGESNDNDPEIEAKDTEIEGSNESRGMPDALYALYYDWAKQKQIQGCSYRHSSEFKNRVCGMRGGDMEADDPKLMTWISKKRAKFACELKVISISPETSLTYLEKDGKPLLSNGMLRPMFEACHKVTGCRATKLLKKDLVEKFCLARWSTDLVAVAARDLKCSV
jgi:hypothetical protein